jgi:hypothetical protein
MIIFFLGFAHIPNVDHWTSGTDFECQDNYRWCSINESFNHKEINWKSDMTIGADGDCVFVRYSNGSLSESTFSVANCSAEKSFICEASLECVNFLQFLSLL